MLQVFKINMFHDVMFYEAFKEEELALKKYLPSNINAGFTWKTVQEAGDVHPPSKFICIRTQSIIPKVWTEIIEGILTRSTGFDHVEKYTDVSCGYLPLYCKRAVAEQAILLMLALLRKLPAQTSHFENFNRNGLTGIECENKTLLVVGVGNIGSEIARIGKGLGMNVLGVDPVKKHGSLKYVSINEGIKKAQVIVCAMNLTDKNRGYFSSKLLRKAPRGCVFINIARGEFVSSGDLLTLLKTGHLGGIGLDVYPFESRLAVSLRNKKRISDGSILLSKHANVICTPHNAFNTMESVDKKARDTILQIKKFRKTKKFLWPVM